MWNITQIKQHAKASELLYKIKDETFKYMHKGVSEYEVQAFIIKKFKEYNLKTDKDKPIVAFRENTGKVHYFPKKKSKKLEKNSMVLIDIWAKLKQGGPYADITWMGYYGKPTKEELKIFNIVIKARDKGLNYIRKEVSKEKIPIGNKVDKIVRDYITQKGYTKEFKHATGHCLGFYSPHGNKGNLKKSNKKPLQRNLAYTIEPGIYLKGKFGARSEIDFYIKKKEVIVTTPLQKKLVII